MYVAGIVIFRMVKQSITPLKWAVLLIVLVFVANPIIAQERFTVDGYVKSFTVGFEQPDIELDHGELDGEFLWANNNRVRLNLGTTLTKWLTLNSSYDLSLRFQDDDLFLTDPVTIFAELPIYRVADPKARIFPDNPGQGDHVALFHNIDRMYFTASAPFFDLIVGRQAIAWGSAHAISPTDILNPFLFTEIDTEDRIGIDAVRLRIPTGSLGELDAGYVGGEDFTWERSAAYLRGKFYALKTDVSLLAMMFRENLLYGLDITRAVWGASIWSEAAYVWADGTGDRTSQSEKMDYLRLSTGVDYNFSVGSGMYTFIEYHYNEAGASESRNYVLNAQKNSTAYIDGSVYLLGRHYLVPGISYQLTALTFLFVESLVSLTDGSVLVTPYIEYNMAENVYLSIGGYGAIGDHPSITSIHGGNATAGMTLSSEFGSYPQQVYAFLRYYF
jgi:hypothetical protein